MIASERFMLDRLKALCEDVIRRDNIDSQRKHSPLKPAADAIEIDTTQQSVDLIVDQIMTLIQEKQEVH